jgi:hypothetical protein
LAARLDLHRFRSLHDTNDIPSIIMPLQKPSAQTEQLLTTLLEKIHATLEETLKQQNDRIAQLEVQPDRYARAIANNPEEASSVALDITGNDPVSNDESPEAAPFHADDYPIIESIWPDPSQAIQIKAASKFWE